MDFCFSLLQKKMGTNARSVITLLSKPRTELQEHAVQQFRLLNKRQSARLSSKHHDVNSRYSMSVAEGPAGQIKNRYSNIIPFNRNRIRLERSDLLGDGIGGEETLIDPSRGDDYINASLIEPPLNIPRRYIATQGPLQSTIGDFWRMIVEKNTKLIVCLSPELENDQEKCARYWPVESECKEIPLGTGDDDDEQQLLLNRHRTLRGLLRLRNPTTTAKRDEARNVVVRVQNIEPEQVDREADCVVRRIQVSFVDTIKNSVIASETVTQLQFLGWADFSVPDQTEPVIALSDCVDRLQPQGAGPIVVHCSAGCGRTGTFCVINSGLAWLRSALSSDTGGSGDNGEVLDDDLVYTLADAFRKQRTTMVQAASQFLFCYRALYDGYRLEFEQAA
ncbi:protein-tyrosine phosphatase-like protein [Zychaea mexicana]|uniref:protein-tyrosine phosphatase-like protein n=1 Tax=Zychaea mexicana TaxID=64656 RepID=UPI0022FEBA24|nr:protein-tyrosine phosphatase-like protein [Zychaea mexicana]KAI9498672.1 protein-tyrosine phosphatase-like protein [Zychaea mexicana]